MSIAIRQIHPVFVGEVSGIDLTQPLSRDEVAAIEAGMDRYAVLFFHDQEITDEQQMVFSRNFGRLEDARGGNITKPEDKRLREGMNDVSNLGRDGQPLTRDSRQRLFNLGNMLWHSDSSFRAIPAKYSLLSARVVNPSGGNTEFADMRAAYDALDADTKAQIEDLVCEHSLMYSRGSLGLLDYSEEERAGRCASGSCARFPSPAASRCTSPLTRAASSACPCPRRGSCCASSPSTPPSRRSSMSTGGASGTWSCGTTAR
jgi:alpha-ketoglutarate-dependent 2,4-dichlorophenoxyacetate dioxygenase